MMNYPRTLVIANNSFSLTNANGRTLGNFFIGWPKNCLAEFCLSTDYPNFDLCNNYYCVTDADALKSFLTFKRAVGRRFRQTDFVQKQLAPGGGTKIHKRVFTMFMRLMIWTWGRWRGAEFDKWVADFNPELILLQNTDSSFLLNIGTRLSKERNIPLVLFNTEGFYFFRRNYMAKGVGDWLLFPLYQKLYRREYRKTMRQASFVIYGNHLLKEDYDKEFKVKSSVLYTVSTLVFSEKKLNTASPVFSYLGKFSFNRHRALITIAEVLQSINTAYRLDVYGLPLDAQIEKELKACPGINFHGFIDYAGVKEVIMKSDVLFHAECQEDRYAESLRYGFSTKIADSISSGKSFFLYSSPYLACARYIVDMGAGWFADTPERLREGLLCLLTDTEERQKVSRRAKVISAENHNLKKNSSEFREILCKVVSNPGNRCL